MGLLTYYFLIVVVFIALIIYNLIFYTTYSADQCPAIVPTPADGSTTTTTATQEYVTNTMVIGPLLLVILYAIIIGLCLIAMLGIYCFGGMSSERFGNLNICWACCGMYVRNFECLTRLLSFVGLIFVAIHAFLTFFNEECQDAVHEYVVNRLIYSDQGAMYRSSIVVVFVNLGFWGATHCLIPVIKQLIDTEAFLYEPFDREKGLTYYVCCKLFGP